MMPVRISAKHIVGQAGSHFFAANIYVTGLIDEFMVSHFSRWEEKNIRRRFFFCRSINQS